MSVKPENIDIEAFEERVRSVAYLIWEEEGRPDGRADDHWLRAERIVMSEMTKGRGLDTPEPGWLKRESIAAARLKTSPPPQDTAKETTRPASKSAAA